MTPTRRSLALAMVAVAAVAALAGLAGSGVRSTFGGEAAVDEPQYLLTALSLAEDGDLDISDELADRRWRDFHDARLPVQTAELADGRQVSPHDPLLPLLLAVPMGLGGWVAAKALLTVVAALLAALLLWTAVRRFGVALPTAAGGVALAAASPPLAVYATQVYPELPAALAVTAAVAALTGAPRPRTAAAVGLAVVALPWLSVKYVPVAAVLTAVALVRWWRAGSRRLAQWTAAALVLAGAVYAVAHRLVWGGWTVYATGDHFEDSGELGVVGFAPDYVGRTIRLVALLTDRGFGLAAWQPAYLLVPLALAALVAARRPHWTAITLPLAAGWATATWVALTMHGYWWPGRQLVVVLPLAVLAVLTWATTRWRALVAAAVAAPGVLAYAWLVVDGRAERLTWVTRFEQVGDPVYRALRVALPDYRDLDAGQWARHGVWLAVVLALAAAGWRAGRRQEARDG